MVYQVCLSKCYRDSILSFVIEAKPLTGSGRTELSLSSYVISVRLEREAVEGSTELLSAHPESVCPEAVEESPFDKLRMSEVYSY